MAMVMEDTGKRSARFFCAHRASVVETYEMHSIKVHVGWRTCIMDVRTFEGSRASKASLDTVGGKPTVEAPVWQQ